MDLRIFRAVRGGHQEGIPPRQLAGGNATSSDDIDLVLDLSQEDCWIELKDRVIIFWEEGGEVGE
jgi:hypothetical protein